MGEAKLPSSVSLPFLEALYQDYLRDPESVSPDWRRYFQGLSEGNGFSKNQTLFPTFKASSLFNPQVLEETVLRRNRPRARFSRNVSINSFETTAFAATWPHGSIPWIFPALP